ncbi:uncharacterized protein L3040_007142 [Drepanopeziza brunnea f. sp. 'multigermtubi']|uniref:Aminotransferase n=1 Tax=Marssonina brunnea f. sp. multigermtubi (strain MB_m1) TaxID=1072389 RepID=K1WJM7_MARBU|nr:aminotransferase [Drepanopeziza brunnea f. sp. 'multigermtubi' MB_m1]EKD13061.1 aminotransferase [Drepanopeziza brunnea f. sp. 'multigermtubi' MB_m1]KAJ5038275.1 hypothetical protein L3040_007142 [Drepanopeziza brunnea f. sp. 'multigermtubi']
MAPSAITELTLSETVSTLPVKGKCLPKDEFTTFNGVSPECSKKTEFLLDRNLHKSFPVVKSGKGNYLQLADGRSIFDATSGAAVSCLGYGNQRIIDAMTAQLSSGIPYLASTFWASEVVEELCKELIDGTGGKMARVYLTGSGSEAVESTIKLCRQYFYEKDNKTSRVNFIAREHSYHGNTIGALGMSGHVARRAPYKPFLMDNVHHVSPCNAYRQCRDGESDAAFVARKAAELEAKFLELGPETVIGFVAEPIVGAALGCVPAVPGYLKAMRDICHKYGALFILDEVMSGMGRSGTLHAWQDEDVVPDVQAVGKGLSAGYQPVAAVLISPKVVSAFLNGSGQFIHGQTFQGMPLQAAAALEVQRILREDNLMENVRTQGTYLEKRLQDLLGDHPNVGNIRGRGLFWGIEFVRDKQTKEPFSVKMGIAQKVHNTAISAPFNMTIYPGTGTADGIDGDHVILAPPYNITQADAEYIANVTSEVIHKVFQFQ